MKNILLLILSLAFSLFICEMILFMNGRYNDPVNTTYSSDIIWERPAATSEYEVHPDLHFPVPVKFDHSGVRNDGPIETEEKKNIYAFFGDSFTENRRILSELTFTEILGRLIPDVAVVNYGVGGYGLDQSYLRYEKFSHHDIKRVFYVFCDNDFRNLYETNLVDTNQNNELVFLKPKRNWVKYLVSKLRVTYLIIEAYYKMWNIKYNDQKIAKAVYRPEYKKRFHDQYADSMLESLLSNTYDENSDIASFRNKFRMILQHWNNELNGKGIRFDIIVLPNYEAQLAAIKLFGDLPLNVLYLTDYLGNTDWSEYHFKNDGHWNEKGNLFAAVAIYRYLGFELPSDGLVINNIESRIADLYAGSSNPIEGGYAPAASRSGSR
jgi:hypothetical protein